MIKPLRLQSDLFSVSQALLLYRLGNNLVGVFIPLVILKSGGELWMIAAFYLVYALVKLGANYPFMRIIQQKGAHFGLGAGFIFGALQLASILAYSVHSNVAFLVAGAAFLAFANAFSWTARHLFVSQTIKNRTRSSNIATMEIYGSLVDIAGPLIGGVIGIFFGSTWLLWVAIICILATFLPLRNMGKVPIKNDFPPVRYDFSGAPRSDLVANFCWNIETSIGLMLWPIYLAVVLASYRSIGGVTAIAAVASIMTIWFAGHRGDRGNDRSVLKQGVAVASLVDLSRIVVATTFDIALVGAIYKSALAYLGNSWTSIYYGNAKVVGPQYIMSMEIACDLAYVALWGTLLTVLLTIGNVNLFFNFAFVVAAMAAWGCLLISRQTKTII